MKKAIALALSVMICATALLSGTIAFFTDEEVKENTFEVGNVNIEQYEKDRDGIDFNQNQSLNPIVTPLEPDPDEEYVDYDGDPDSNVQLRNTEYFSNYLDKIVTVENLGKNAAYVRNIVAIPTGLPAGAQNVDWLEVDFLDANGSDNADWTALENPVEEDVEIDGVLYDLYVFNYTGTSGKLQPKDTTLPTLLGFGMSSHVDFEEKLTKTDDTYTDEHGNTASFAIEYETGKYGAFYYRDPVTNERTYLTITSLDKNHIYVATQAVQAEGFENSAHAFKNGFNGDITEKNHPWYEAPVEPIMGKVGEKEYTWKQLEDEQLVTVTDGVLTYINPSITELIITKDNVQKIQYSAYSNHSLETLSIGDGIILGPSAFMAWKNLKTVSLGAVTFEYYWHFNSCSGLKSVTLSEGITSIPEGIFSGCINLNNVVVPSTVTVIGNSAFANCNCLKNIKLPSYCEGKMDAAETERIFGTPYKPTNITYHS